MINRETVKEFFNDLISKGDFDITTELLWGFYFIDEDAELLKNLATSLEPNGFMINSIFEQEETENETRKLFYLNIEKRMINDEDTLHSINQSFYQIAEQIGVVYDGFDVGH